MTAQNHLLSSMPQALSDKLAPALKRVALSKGDRLHDPGESIDDIYFPLDCVLSITLIMEDGTTTETGIVGAREMIGVNAFMGGKETTQTAYIVRIAGSALKINADVLLNEFDCNKDLRDVLLGYTQAFIAQISQTTACNNLHNIEQRLARWLLEVQDRVEGDELALTHEFLAGMLGVRRAGISQAAQVLQERGVIRYHRGHIQILDRSMLETFSCECFQAVKAEYDRLLGTKT